MLNEQNDQEQMVGCEVEDRRTAKDRRQSVVDRRHGSERRHSLERRRGPGRRRAENRRSAEEGELNDEQFAFVMAIDEYRRANNRPFPTWTEVLDVVKYLGYRKVAKIGEHVDRPSDEDLESDEEFDS